MVSVCLSRASFDRLRDRLADLDVEPLVLEDGASDPEVVWASTDVYRDDDLTRDLFRTALRSSRLRWLQTSSAGSDHGIFQRLRDDGVVVTTSHVTGPPIAEYVMRAVLDHFQRAGEWRDAVARRQWRGHDFREVSGTTWLLVGFGSINLEVARRARAFGAHVIGVRRTIRGDEPVDEMITSGELLQHLPRADVVVLAVPHTAETDGLVDDRFLTAMRPGSVLVNVARGGLVDEDALLRALDGGVPEAALLDVVVQEPLDESSPLWSHPSIVLTPHSAALSHGRHARADDAFLVNLRRYLAGEPLRHVSA